MSVIIWIVVFPWLFLQHPVCTGPTAKYGLMDGVMILIAGVLLITPGLITDTAGFLLLIPAVQSTIRVWLRRKLEEKFRDGTANITFWRW